MPTGGAFSTAIVDERPGQTTLEISGEEAISAFRHERGGQRWQRIPPTEKRGRVQTSTVTVATLAPPPPGTPPIPDHEIDEDLFRRSKGAGGQHNNKSATAVRLLHKPTGIRVEVCNERSQSANRKIAHSLLAARVAERLAGAKAAVRSAKRRSQVGTGMRGDKARTYRVRDDTVTDHVTGRKARLVDVLAGKLELLFG